MLRTLLAGGWIVAVWIALWGDLSWANLVGGALVAALVLAVVRLPPQRGRRRPALAPTLRYAVLFVRDLVVATAEVARQVFWPTERLRPSIVEVPMASTNPGLLALVANTITLTPGTLTLDADAERGLLWVHVLHLEEGGKPEVVAHAQALELLGARALGIEIGAAAASEAS